MAEASVESVANILGPGVATDNAIARFNGTTGKVLQNSGITIDDVDNLLVPGAAELRLRDTTLKSISTGVMQLGASISVDISSPLLNAISANFTGSVGFDTATPVCRLDLGNQAPGIDTPVEYWRASAANATWPMGASAIYDSGQVDHYLTFNGYLDGGTAAAPTFFGSPATGGTFIRDYRSPGSNFAMQFGSFGSGAGQSPSVAMTILTASNYVGIGVSPTNVLHVRDPANSGGTGLHIDKPNTNSVLKVTTDVNGDGMLSLYDLSGTVDVQLSTDPTTPSYFNSGSNLGVGTNAPGSNRLSVISAVGDVGISISDATNYTGHIKRIPGETGMWVGGTTASNLALAANNAEVMRIQTNGKVGIGTTTIPHLGIGRAKLAIEGTDSSITDGPDVQWTTSADNFPLVGLYPFAHDNITLSLDAYATSTWLSSDPVSNYRLTKFGDKLLFDAAGGHTAGTAVTWITALQIEADGEVMHSPGASRKFYIRDTGISISSGADSIGQLEADGYWRVGTATTTHAIPANSLLVSGALEVDGVSWFDGNVTVGANTTLNGIVTVDNGAASFISFVGTTYGRMTFNDGSADTAYIGVQHGYDAGNLLTDAGAGRQWIIGEASYWNNDFDHAIQVDPTLFVHSATDPNTSNTQWWSIAHNKTNALYDLGSGKHLFDGGNLKMDGGHSVEVSSSDWVYWGDPDTNGTWRRGRSGDNFVAQRRESGVYVTKATTVP
jgi:hypothetical protein